MIEKTIGTIQGKANNLQYLSEQTHEVNVFVIGRGILELDEQTFNDANPFINGRAIETLDAETVCDRQGWFELKTFLLNELREVTAFKVGTTQIEIYVVGLLEGYIVGVRSFAVET